MNKMLITGCQAKYKAEEGYPEVCQIKLILSLYSIQTPFPNV